MPLSAVGTTDDFQPPPQVAETALPWKLGVHWPGWGEKSRLPKLPFPQSSSQTGGRKEEEKWEKHKTAIKVSCTQCSEGSSGKTIV